MTLSTSTTRTQVLGADWGGRGRGAPAGARAGGPAPAATPTDADGGAAPPPTGRRAGGPPGTTSPRATSTTSYAQMPVTHRLENIGDRLFRAMVVVNETAGDETTTEQAAGFDGKPELTNGWFRAYRLTLAAGQKTPTHRHRAPVVIFQATNGKGFGSGPMKFEFNEPGQWAFFDASAEHEIGKLRHRPVGAHRSRGPPQITARGQVLNPHFFRDLASPWASQAVAEDFTRTVSGVK